MRIWVVRACDGECGEAVGIAESREQALEMIRRKAAETVAEYKRCYDDDAKTIDNEIAKDSYHAALVEAGLYEPSEIESIHCDGCGNVT